jgi:hypothetical protein
MEEMDRIEELKEIFMLAKSKKSYSEFFDMKNGGNGLVLFPKDERYKAFCIKTPITEEVKEGILRSAEDEFDRNYFESTVKVNVSLLDDVLSYNRIIKNEKLREYIPKFYLPETIEENVLEPDFIIMEWVRGEYFDNILPARSENLANPDKMVLSEKIYRLFRDEGLEFGDHFEYFQNGDIIKIVDLAQIDKKPDKSE